MARGMEKGQFWRGYRRPVLRDGVFWFAMLIGVAGLAVQSPLADWKGQTIDWVVLVASVVLTFAASFIIIGVLAATIRGFGEGWKEADKAPTPKATPPPTATTRAAESSSPRAEPTPKPTATPATDRPAIGVSMEKKVRVFGRAVGAARRTYRDYE